MGLSEDRGEAKGSVLSGAKETRTDVGEDAGEVAEEREEAVGVGAEWGLTGISKGEGRFRSRAAVTAVEDRGAFSSLRLHAASLSETLTGAKADVEKLWSGFRKMTVE